MANEKFSIQDALKYGWSSFKAHIPFFLGAMLVMAVVTIVPDKITDMLFQPRTAMFILCKLLIRLVGLLLGMVATRLSLDIYDKGEPDLAHLGDLSSLIPYYLGGKILYGAIVLVGLLLLVVPGCIAAYMFLYVGYLTVDKGLGPIAALQESRALTDGYKLDLFIFSIVVAFLNVVGIICLFVGLFATIPTTLMASAYVYRRLSPKAAASV